MASQQTAANRYVPDELLSAWMAGQRWYANRGGFPVIDHIGSWTLDTDEPGVELVTHLILDHTAGSPALYQVPLSYRDAQTDEAGMPLGLVDDRWVYDAPHDQAFTRALLTQIIGEQESVGDRMTAAGQLAAAAVRVPTPATARVSQVLTGEQSNTSIVFEAADSSVAPLICKLFRALHDGPNPDVVLQTALAEAGSDAVPRPLGNIVADWSDRGQQSGRATGHVAFAQEFLPGAQDGWKVARAAAIAGDDFSEQAHALGFATARTHATLAVVLPTLPASAAEIAAVIAQMHGRLAAAIAVVPELAAHEPALRELLDRAAVAQWPAQQRIHGDLHLGQVLAVPERGWVLVDFEGEPLRPMRERSRLDSPLRDVAGMLRSFDYVVGSLGLSSETATGPSTDEWVAAARSAFAQGYSEASGFDLIAARTLLDAFEVDKALYETVYEARNRPDWLGIPVAAIERLATRVAG